jgi:hypothetical protein
MSAELTLFRRRRHRVFRQGKFIETYKAGRRMHLCMQDDQIGEKIVGLAPADMARLPPSIITKNKTF